MKCNFVSTILVLILAIMLSGNNISAQQHDIVHGNLIQFNDNGLWCWFQDERAIVDTNEGKLIIGSATSQAGVGFSIRNGMDDAVLFDLKTGLSKRYELAKMSTDDHNAPGFIIRPDGKYIAMYSAHYDYYKNRYRIFDGNSWSPEQAYDWTKRPGGTDYTIAYNNIYYLSDENRMYDFSRANHRSPNFIVSTDMGNTWTFGGQLTTNTSNSYNKGYYKYWSNGKDRIDFIFTEQHPRDTLTSIYHGYITGGKAYRSDGTLVDDNIFDTTYIPAYWDFTKVFANGTVIGNDTLYRCWQSDLMRYNDGTIEAIITARVNQSISYGYPDNNVNPQHAFIFCRYDGSNWSYTFLDLAGYKFYSSEADYVGLGALCPNDPNTLYISTPYDPRDTSAILPVREIFKGVTSNNGATWSWAPITENSTRDNIRPIVPAWNKENNVLLWCRGTYFTAQSFDAAVVGIIDRTSETIGKKNYVDATTTNTTMAYGSTLVATGPDSNDGASDNMWHIRTGIGNGNTVLTSAELRSGENAPMIKTHVDLPDTGMYDVWVNFWGLPTSDWRIKAGLTINSMQLFRSMACQQVDSANYNNQPIISYGGDGLYQAYLGRISDISGFDVFIDDSAYRAGTANPTLTGVFDRTWYDGISYAKVNSETTVNVVNSKSIPVEFKLSQNYPNPFNPSTRIRFSIPRSGLVTLKIYDVLGKEVATLIEKGMNAGSHSITWNAGNMPSGIYFYRIMAGNYTMTKKMMLLK